VIFCLCFSEILASGQAHNAWISESPRTQKFFLPGSKWTSHLTSTWIDQVIIKNGGNFLWHLADLMQCDLVYDVVLLHRCRGDVMIMSK
jgi:hypothetical protein